ncbi:MAG: histidine kinase [Bacteroidetes bacterium]|nr:histidine kinase [Bacteroidota bacterium]
MTIISYITLSKVLKYYELLRAELKNRLLRKRMEPHFMGNLLQSLTGMFYLGKKKELIEVIGESSKLIKADFENLDSDIIPLAQEMKLLKQFLHTRNIMSEGKIFYEFRLAYHSQVKDVYIPSMLLQPITENALEHGLKNNTNPIIIVAFLISDKLRVRIIDNGPGMHENMKKRNGSLSVTKERLNILRQIEGRNYELSIMKDLSEYHIEQGCGIEITLPIITATT